jgi:drug/metabolite transporter (DMT)-like permease
MTFLIGGLIGAATWPFRSNAMASLHQSWKVWLLGVGGLFGYHFVYFSAIRAAPAVEVSLIAYLWPLFLVLFSAFLPGERLKLHHVIGVALGLAGAIVIITRGKGSSLFNGLEVGHVLAFACSLIWSGYSVLSRRFGKVPTDAVAGFCLLTALLSAVCHLAFETTVWPADALQWAAVLGLGLLPVGAAFYSWDYGVKHGDIMVLGAASYASPLLSTLVLVTAGFAPLTWAVLVACLLITAGAVIAAKDMLLNRGPAT